MEEKPPPSLQTITGEVTRSSGRERERAVCKPDVLHALTHTHTHTHTLRQ